MLSSSVHEVHSAPIPTGLIPTLGQNLEAFIDPAAGLAAHDQLPPHREPQTDAGQLEPPALPTSPTLSHEANSARMHTQMNGSAGMDQETSIAMHHGREDHLAHDSNHTYENEGAWGHQVDMHGFQQLSPHETSVAQYPTTTYSFMPPIITHGLPSHGLPSESIGRMPPPPPPPPPHSMAQTSAAHPQPPMLVMPSHATWPSMLTNPNSYGSHSAPPLTMPSVQVTLKTKLPALHTQPVPRKTLTDDDRRRMCQYAEDNPHSKQTEIGAKFGVERSTVSKVLRNKEKYLYPEEKGTATSSPIKRKTKGGVDIERALTNYVRNAQRSGIPVTDADIKEKARLFSATMVKADDSLGKVCSTSWLEKFKQKNGIGHGKLMRRASETNISDNMRGSPSLSASQPNSAISPSSPSIHPSPSPLSANRSEDGKENMAGYLDFNTEPGSYKHTNSQSTTSLHSAFTDGGNSSFSGGAMSPNGPFSFSPDGNVGAFQPLPPGGPGSNFQRPRSQTFPTLDLEYMNQPQASEPVTPKYHISTAPSSALESPANELPQPTYGMDRAISSPQLRHSSSSNSLVGAGQRSATASVAASGPNSPTQEDAQRAAATLLSFIQNAGAFVDQSEYMAVVRLTEKLRIHQAQQQQQQQQQSLMGMGGLDRIPEGDSEMGNTSGEIGLGVKMEPGA